MSTYKKIIIIEDNDEVREAIILLLSSRSDLIIKGDYDNCEDAIRELNDTKPDIVLMDIDLPGMSGIEGTEKIHKARPKSDIIIITVFENSKTVFRALCAGANGYLTKNTDVERLGNAIDEVIKGGAPMSTKIAKMVVQSFQRNTDSPLTDRETEVLLRLSEGKSYGNIADDLFISRDTVKYHIKNIYLKLQVKSKAEAIKIANAEKFI